MIEFISQLFSAIIGLTLINAAVLYNSHTCHTRFLGKLPIEVRYIVFLSFLILLALNGNQWIAGNLLFPLLIFIAILSIWKSIRRVNDCDQREIFRDGISLFLTQAVTIFVVFSIFQMHKFWLLESSNHDSIIYYYGGYWANESRMFVGSEAVRAQWGFDTWIGFDKPLYRGGTYTLAAWIQYFSPRTTGNALYYIAAYSATIAWFAVRLLATSVYGINSVAISASLALTVALSTGFVGALINSNLATVMGAASLLMTFALTLRSDIQASIRYVLIAIWCAVCAHFYGESVFYAGLLAFLVFLFELPKLYKSLGITRSIRLIAISSCIVLILGNIPVAQSLSSLLFLSEIAKGGNWTSWYIHQPSIAWTGSFVAGMLMGASPKIPIVVSASIITLFSAACLANSIRHRVGIFALIGVSIFSVAYVELTSYQYGEHKILHLIGPSWGFAVISAALFLLSKPHPTHKKPLAHIRKTLTASLFFILGLIITSFLSNSISLLKQMPGPHSLDFGLHELTSFVRPGESVLIDDTQWTGVEKFFKAHYLIFHMQHQKAKVLMPSIASDVLRGGNQRGFVGDTLRNAEKVDWLIKGKGYSPKKEKFASVYGEPIWENEDFRLYRVSNQPVVVAGNGWQDCEPDYCWTQAPFDVEAHHTATLNFQLLVNFSAYSPPKNGLIIIRDHNHKIIKEIDASTKTIEINIDKGWSRLTFEPSWEVTSPKELGLSRDHRKLFLAIQRIEPKSSHNSKEN